MGLISFIPDAFSIPIDLSQKEFKVLTPFQIGKQNSLELYGFKKNTIYILHFEGEIQLSNVSTHLPVTITENNSVLIENEEQLNEDDVLTLRVAPKLKDTQELPEITIQLIKITIKTDRYANLGNEKWGDFIDQVNCTMPGAVTKRLVEITKPGPLKHVFIVGCESGKDPVYWAEHGFDVTVLDGTPHAVAKTCLHLYQFSEITP